MISLDISILYQVVLFVLLWLILSKLLFKPYLGLLEERERRTTGAQHDSADLEDEGARLKMQYEEKIAQAQAAAYAAKEAIIREARQQRETILSQARDEASKSLQQVRTDIASALQREKQLGEAEVTVVAQDIVSKVLGRRVA
jgi:F-type H+-transporting ATPase subunit b